MRRYFVLVSLVSLSFGFSAFAADIEAPLAAKCTDRSNCAYFDEVYSGTPEFREALGSAFQSAGIEQPSWIGKGTNFPLLPILLDKQLYLLGSVCEPHNCVHQVVVLYDPATRKVRADYVKEEGKSQPLGDVSSKEREVLAGYQNESSKVRGALDDSSQSLPVSLDPLL